MVSPAMSERIGAGDRGDRDAEVGGLVAVDVDRHLGLAAAVGDVEVDELAGGLSSSARRASAAVVTSRGRCRGSRTGWLGAEAAVAAEGLTSSTVMLTPGMPAKRSRTQFIASMLAEGRSCGRPG
jgi:TctA family transporter